MDVSKSSVARPRASELKLVLLFLASAGTIGCLFVIALAGSDNYTPHLLFKPKEIPYTHGWPWIFAERNCPATSPWLVKRFVIWTYVKEWRPGVLMADLAVLLGCCLLVLLVARRIWRSRGLRFTLGTAALGLTAACSGMGYVSYHQRLERREIQIAERLDTYGCSLREKKYRGPRWWLQLVGHSKSFRGTLHHYTHVRLSGTPEASTEMGRMLAMLPYLRTIEVYGGWNDTHVRELLAAADAWPIEALEWRGDFTGAGLAELPKCSRLKRLQLFSKGVDESAMQQASRCPKLEELWTDGLSDAGARHLAAGLRLRILEAPETQLSDAGLKALVTCHELEEINLRGAQLTERSVATFRNFPKLKRLAVGPFVEREPEDPKRFARLVGELGVADAHYHPSGQTFAHTPGD